MMPYKASFEGGLVLELEWPDVRQCSHSGDCWEDVNRALGRPYVQEQFAQYEDWQLKQALMDHGAWTGEELLSRADNKRRIVWLAACQILEEEEKFHTADPQEHGEHWHTEGMYLCDFIEETNGDIYCTCRNTDIEPFYIGTDDLKTLDGWIQDHRQGYISMDTLKELMRKVDRVAEIQFDLAERVCLVFGWTPPMERKNVFEQLCITILDAYNKQSEEVARLNKHVTKLDEMLARPK